ncbi:MAG: hypothetical protein GQ559_10380 [Desulfobulbaceae bacterium]|nr:hypothetical protein [Desulfobulbaceae bacterium]
MTQIRKIILLLISITLLVACSDERDTESQKGAIEKMTDKTAEKAVQHIQAPIDKALQVKQIEDEQAKAMEKAAKN